MSQVLQAVLSTEVRGRDDAGLLTLRDLIETCDCISDTQRRALEEELRQLQSKRNKKDFAQRVHGLTARVRVRHGLTKLHQLCRPSRRRHHHLYPPQPQHELAASRTTLNLGKAAGQVSYLSVRKLSIGTWVWEPGATGALLVYFSRARPSVLSYYLEPQGGSSSHGHYRIDTPVSAIRRIFLAEDGGAEGLSRIGVEAAGFCLEFAGASLLHRGEAGDFTEGLQRTSDCWVHYLFALRGDVAQELGGLIAHGDFAGEVDACLVKGPEDEEA